MILAAAHHSGLNVRVPLNISIALKPSGDSLIYPRFAPVGDCALSVEFGDVIDPAVNALVSALDRAIAVANIAGVVETVPSFRALLIVYEPEAIELDRLLDAVKRIIDDGLRARERPGRSWIVPVAYGVNDDGDLREVAGATGLSCDDVI